jgi:hypothetical protein
MRTSPWGTIGVGSASADGGGTARVIENNKASDASCSKTPRLRASKPAGMGDPEGRMWFKRESISDGMRARLQASGNLAP